MGGYYIASDSGKSGPFSLDQLKAQHIDRDMWIWRQGITDWSAAGDIPELALLFAPSNPSVKAKLGSGYGWIKGLVAGASLPLGGPLAPDSSPTQTHNNGAGATRPIFAARFVTATGRVLIRVQAAMRILVKLIAVVWAKFLRPTVIRVACQADRAVAPYVPNPSHRRAMFVLVALGAFGAASVGLALVYGTGRIVRSDVFSNPNLNGAVAEQVIRVPLLTVSGEQGTVVDAQLRYSRDTDRSSPPLISVEEDTPSGAGGGIRASLWQAAMVAGLSREDDLGGVHLSLRLPGRVDGPSAGGMMCLAILSALDGRTLPADFAFTGTIMPDGGVGAVGGVRHKIRAASAHGLKRVIVPDLLRMEASDSAGKNVDLKEVALEQGMQFLAVSNVEQAYHFAHHMDLPPPGALPADVLVLPRPIEQYLKRRYEQARTEAKQTLEKLPTERQHTYRSDPVFQRLNQHTAKADEAYRSGRFSYAADAAQSGVWLIRAVIEADDMIAQSPTVDPMTAINATDPKALEFFTSVPRIGDVLDSAKLRMRLIGSQLCVELGDALVAPVMSDKFHRQIQAAMGAKPDPATLAEGAAALRRCDLIFALAMRKALTSFADESAGLAALLPETTPSPRAAGTERLLYGACSAADDSFNSGVLDLVAEMGENLTAEKALVWMQDHDDEMAGYLMLPLLGENLHRDLVTRTGDPFLTPAIAQFHADRLGRLAAISARWQQLEPFMDESGKLVSRRKEVLTRLLHLARERALLNITDCDRRRIPCFRPVALIEEADSKRDDGETDPVEVLGDYYRAGLQAKALLMLFH